LARRRARRALILTAVPLAPPAGRRNGAALILEPADFFERPAGLSLGAAAAGRGPVSSPAAPDPAGQPAGRQSDEEDDQDRLPHRRTLPLLQLSLITYKPPGHTVKPGRRFLSPQGLPGLAVY